VVGAPLCTLCVLIRQLRILREEVIRQHLLGPVRGLEPAVEYGLDDSVIEGQIGNQQIAVHPVELFGHALPPPHTLTTERTP
jgi:hypothetical protein